MSGKGCELCGKDARMFCESDQARLCWGCDEKVHSANFLVAKHCRTLLCHVCGSPTPWKAAGLSLGPAVSVCRSCSERGLRRATESGEIEGGDRGNDDYQESESDDGEFDSDSEYCSGEIGEEEDGENQVVPWSIGDSPPPSPSPPAAASSACSEDDASFSSLKRFREAPFESENEDGCCSSRNPGSKIAPPDSNLEVSCDFGPSSRTLFRPSKLRKTNLHTELTQAVPWAAAQNHQGNLASGSAADIDRLRRFRQEMTPEGGVPPK